MYPAVGDRGMVAFFGSLASFQARLRVDGMQIRWQPHVLPKSAHAAPQAQAVTTDQARAQPRRLPTQQGKRADGRGERRLPFDW